MYHSSHSVLWLLAQVYNRPPPDPAVIAEYEALPIGATPHSLIDASLVARNDADIEVMSKAFTGDREGYANTHRQPTAETMARVAQDFSAAEDDAGENHICSVLYRTIVSNLKAVPLTFIPTTLYLSDVGPMAGIDSAETCLLYPSDASEEKRGVNAGSRSIHKKKQSKQTI